jgi:hypothetical protein
MLKRSDKTKSFGSAGDIVATVEQQDGVVRFLGVTAMMVSGICGLCLLTCTVRLMECSPASCSTCNMGADHSGWIEQERCFILVACYMRATHQPLRNLAAPMS